MKEKTKNTSKKEKKEHKQEQACVTASPNMNFNCHKHLINIFTKHMNYTS